MGSWRRGKFVSTFRNGFHELTLRQEQLFESYAPEFQPYNLTDNLYFPYMLKDGRIGFVTDNEVYPNFRFFFDVRSDGPIYTGPQGQETVAAGAPGYSEYFYLTENADVLSLVEAGDYPDGLSHFLQVGRNEGRWSFAPGTYVHGDAGDDQIILREGNERAIGYAGNDFIDGSSGFDTAVYALAKDDYWISTDGARYYVTALSGDEGRDVLVEMEAGIFDNETITFAGDDDLDGVPNWQDVFPQDIGRSGDADGDGQDNNFTFIEALARAGVTAGCGSNNYCPEDSVTRAQMAVFLERGMHGSNFSPPAAVGNVFLDVGANDFAASYYCPNATVTRDQMAVFLLRAKYGSGYSPPVATGVFTDVPLSHWAVHWIEQLEAEGITAGCGGGDYCPDAEVTRDQMAVFLVRTFGL